MQISGKYTTFFYKTLHVCVYANINVSEHWYIKNNLISIQKNECAFRLEDLSIIFIHAGV